MREDSGRGSIMPGPNWPRGSGVSGTAGGQMSQSWGQSQAQNFVEQTQATFQQAMQQASQQQMVQAQQIRDYRINPAQSFEDLSNGIRSATMNIQQQQAHYNRYYSTTGTLYPRPTEIDPLEPLIRWLNSSPYKIIEELILVPEVFDQLSKKYGNTDPEKFMFSSIVIRNKDYIFNLDKFLEVVPKNET